MTWTSKAWTQLLVEPSVVKWDGLAYVITESQCNVTVTFTCISLADTFIQSKATHHNTMDLCIMDSFISHAKKQ